MYFVEKYFYQMKKVKYINKFLFISREKSLMKESLEQLNIDLSILKDTHEDLRQSQQDAITQVGG